MSTIYAADIFCGAGGASTGLAQAAESMARGLDLLAVDQWDVALETHARNHPNARHSCAPVENVAVPRRLDLLWASPECTNHSVARGSRPCSDESRSSAWEVVRWASQADIKKIIIENVPEFLRWGPLGRDGRPIPSRTGETFRQFVVALESHGYRVDWRVLCAADYGDPTTRRRLFIQAGKSGSIRWPDPTHRETPDMFTSQPWRTARDIIDWTISGNPISRRRKALSRNTIRRIESGIEKYWGEVAEPFLISLRGTSSSQITKSHESISRPIRTISAGGIHESLIAPFLLRYNSGDNRHAPISRPIGTLDTNPRYGLIKPVLVQYNGMSKSHPISEPINTVTSKERYSLIDGDLYTVDITHRMLQPNELAAAQGFPPEYHFCGTKTDTIKQIGNSVPVNTADALCRAALENA